MAEVLTIRNFSHSTGSCFYWEGKHGAKIVLFMADEVDSSRFPKTVDDGWVKILSFFLKPY